MNRTTVCALLSVLALSAAAPAGAQTPSAGINPTPPLLLIYREEVRPGKGAAHEANENAWASAYTKGGAPLHWLGMVSMTGANEAWFLSGYASYDALQKAEDAIEDSAALRAESDKFSANEAELLSRTSVIVSRYRSDLSYQAESTNLPAARFMSVQTFRVKPGRAGEFADSWRMVVEAHKKAKLDEHWAVYQVESGLPDGTFLFFYARKSMAEIDASGPMHSAAGYRDAVGEGGRVRLREMNESTVDMSQWMHFRMRPGMSTLPKEWAEADTFWAPKAAAPAMAGRATEKKK
jgi:hypothetical protein